MTRQHPRSPEPIRTSAPDSTNVVVVVPTLNERDDLPVLVEQLMALDVDGLSVLVVDDNSPDGTGRLAEDLGAEHRGRVRVLRRPGKSGIDRAHVANRYVNAVVDLGIRDATSGFKAWRSTTLAAIDLGSVRSDGYSFQVETAYRTSRAGLRIAEVPIHFEERSAGASKMSLRVQFESAVMPWTLRRRPVPGPAHPDDLVLVTSSTQWT